MKPTTIILVAAGIAVLGTWAKKHTLEPKMVVGGAVVALTVGFIADGNEKLGKDFAWLVLVATAGAYGDDLFTAIGSAPSMVTGKVGSGTTAGNNLVSGPGGTGHI